MHRLYWRRVRARVPLARLAWLALLLAACAGPRVDAPPASAAHSCTAPPFAETLYLRGTPTTWTLREDLAFRYRCDAYELNVDLNGAHEFRITDAKFTGGLSFGSPQRDAATLQPDESFAAARDAPANLRFAFSGKHTLRVAFDSGRSNPHITITSGNDSAAMTPPIGDPIARSVHFDSRDLADKAPFGAVSAGTDVAFKLDALPGAKAVTLVIALRRIEGPQEVLEYHEVARVPLGRARVGAREQWHGNYPFANIGVYGYYFVIEVGAKKYRYENNADTIYWTRELGSNGTGGIAAEDDTAPIRYFRQTVYRTDYHVPDWARDVVFYYIFPERFRNGDRRNDPKPGPHTFHDKSVEVHAHWLEKPWLPRSGDGSDDLYGNDFFGGDLAGIIEKLDYIADLGANTLYLTPIFRAASNHKYDTADYKNIDPHFGTNADFERLTHEAGKRGLRVILDTSLNHSGSDSIYFDRYANYPGIGAFKGGEVQPESPYADWYHFEPTQTDPNKQYGGWAGAQDLPELNKTSPSFREFAFGAPDSVMKLWLDRGAAGWRMDVAPWVPDDFWRAWRSAVKQHRPDALTIAETQFEASKFFLGDEFDSTMNYVFRNAVQDYANGVSARTAYRAIELMRETYPPQAFFALMNLLSTHDSARALYEFGWRDEHADAATIALAKQRLRLAAFFQMTFPGAPAVFYGDEVGVTGGEDPYNRVTYPWPDAGGRPDLDLLAEYKRLIKLRNTTPVLRHGSIDAPAWLDEHVIALIRRDGDAWAITATNNDRIAHTITLQLPPQLSNATFVDTLTTARAQSASGAITVEVPAMYGTVLIKQ
jgi:glycosidase